MSRYLSDAQKIQIVKDYQKISASQIAANFNLNSPNRPWRLNERTVRKIVDKFNKEGVVTKKKPINPKCKSRNPEIIQAIATIFEDNPNTSLSQANRDTGFAIGTIRKCLKTRKFHPYKYGRTFQQKNPQDMLTRIEYCTNILSNIENDPAFLARILWSDESLFLLHGTPNKQNYRYEFSFCRFGRFIYLGCIAFQTLGKSQSRLVNRVKSPTKK